MTLVLAAHAKLNLSLRITATRPDGMHELESVIQAISLHDLLEAFPAPETSLEVEGDAPAGPDNLVLRAARALEEAEGRVLPARFRLLKRIPAGSGLGGGSSDAAAALRLLRRLHGVRSDLAPVAARLGADVPFFLRGGRAIATGTGDRLQPGHPGHEWYAIARPGFGVSTAEVYRAWDTLPESDRAGGYGNDLEPAALAAEPRLRSFREQLGGGWVMTGSGSAFFRPAPTEQEARQAMEGLPCWTALAQPVGAWA